MKKRRGNSPFFMEHHSDEQLIAGYLKGDEKSLEILIKRYLAPIYSFALGRVRNAKEAEDITQETFVRVWRNLRKFRNEENFKIWIFTIAGNAAIDSIRKKKAAPFSDFENEKGENAVLETLADANPSAAELADGKLEKIKLDSAKEKLSDRHKMVLKLRYDKDFTFREIAGFLGESLNTVKSRHRRGLILLKKILEND